MLPVCQKKKFNKLGEKKKAPVNFLKTGGQIPLEEAMATHSSILAWRIPKTEEPGGLQSMESQRVRPD